MMAENSNSRVKYFAKNVGILGVSNFTSKILVFLLVPLYTSVLSTSEYGIYDMIYSMIQLVFPLLTLNITEGVMRFSLDKTKDIREVGEIGLKYLFFSMVLVGGFLILSHENGWIEAIQGLEGYIFIYVLSYFLNQFLIQFAKGQERVKDMGVCGIIGTFMLLGGNLLFLLVFKWGLEGFLLANILCQGGSVLYLAVRLHLWQYIRVNNWYDLRSLQKEMLIYSMPLIFTTVGWWVNNALDKYAVTFIVGVSATGILSVAYKIPTILSTLQSIFIQAWQISAIKEYEVGDSSKFYGIMFSYLNFMVCCAAIVLIMLTRPIASIMYSKNFYAAWQYVPFLILAAVFNSAAGFLGPILSAAKNSVSMAKSAIYGSLVNLVMNIALIYAMGVQGATIATAISSYAIYIVRKWAVGEQICVPAYWKIYMNWVFVIVMAILEIYTGSYIAECVVIVVIAVLNYKEIMLLATKMKEAGSEFVVKIRDKAE